MTAIRTLSPLKRLVKPNKGTNATPAQSAPPAPTHRHAWPERWPLVDMMEHLTFIEVDQRLTREQALQATARMAGHETAHGFLSDAVAELVADAFPPGRLPSICPVDFSERVALTVDDDIPHHEAEQTVALAFGFKSAAHVRLAIAHQVLRVRSH